MTVRQKLIESLQQMFARHGGEEAAPSLVLWPDEKELWRGVLPALRNELPGLLTFGAYDRDSKTGPAIWLRCMLAGVLGDPIPEEPVVYLPGVSRSDLRNAEDAPRRVQPLIALQYEGIVWSHPNGKDWTPAAFLSQLGLEVAADEATKVALQERLPRILESTVEELAALGRLDSVKVLNFGSDWPSAILAWMEKPAERGDDWEALRAACQAQYGFDPQTDGELAAAELLAQASGAWQAVWKRFADAPRRCAGTVALLGRVEPPAGFSGLLAPLCEGYPKINDASESSLRAELGKLVKLDSASARKRIIELDQEHSERLKWVWCELGEARLAQAVHGLAKCALVANKDLSATSIEELIKRYEKWGWEGDLAAWQSFASVASTDEKLIADVLRVIYLPWVQNSAEVFAALVQKSSLRSLWKPVDAPAAGECLLFADGLRFDVAQLLRKELEQLGGMVELRARVSALPGVTPTAKPAVSPVSNLLKGTESGADFMPTIAATGKALTSDGFRDLLQGIGVQVIPKDEVGDPSKAGWTEAGSLDRRGHDEGARFVKQIQGEVKMLTERVQALLEEGWRQVIVVTDHGWLWMPGGLPKAELPQHLAESRWGRCAVMKSSSTTELHTVPWHYDDSVIIAVPPGISCFKAGYEYSHGGLSLQECIIPVLTVASTVAEPPASIESVSWAGLRCRLKAVGSPDWVVDIRTKLADISTSLTVEQKPLGESGSPTLLVSDDHEGLAAVIVICDKAGRVVAKKSTTIGVNE